MADIDLAGSSGGTAAVVDQVTPRQGIDSTSPDVFWPCQDGSGSTIADVVGSKAMSILVGSWATGQGGPEATSFYCTAGSNVDGAKYTGTIDTLNAVGLSWQVWVKPLSLYNYGPALAGNSWDTGAMHSETGGAIYVGTNGSNRFLTAAGTLKVGQWYHLTFTQGLVGGNWVSKFYVNGIEVATTTGGMSRPIADMAAWILRSGPFYTQHHAIWFRALSAMEVKRAYGTFGLGIANPVAGSSAGAGAGAATMAFIAWNMLGTGASAGQGGGAANIGFRIPLAGSSAGKASAALISKGVMPFGIGSAAALGDPLTTRRASSTISTVNDVFDPQPDPRPHPAGIASTLKFGTLTVNCPLGTAGAAGQAVVAGALTTDRVFTALAAGKGGTAAGQKLYVARPLDAQSSGVGGGSGTLGSTSSVSALTPEAVAGMATVTGDLERHVLRGAVAGGVTVVQAAMGLPGLRAEVAATSTVAPARVSWNGRVSGNAVGTAWPIGRLGYWTPLPSAQVSAGSSTATASELTAVNMRGTAEGAGSLTSRLYYVGGASLGATPLGLSSVTGTAKRIRMQEGAPAGAAVTWGHIWKQPDDIFANVAGDSEVTARATQRIRAATSGTSTATARISSARRIGTGTAAGTATVTGMGTFGTAGWVLAKSTATARLVRDRLLGGAIAGVATVPGRNLTRVAFYGDAIGDSLVNDAMLAMRMRGTAVGAASIRTIYESGALSAVGRVDMIELPRGRLLAQWCRPSSLVTVTDLDIHTFRTLTVPGWVTVSRPTLRQMATWVEAGPSGERVPRYGEQDATGQYVSISELDVPIRRKATYRV